VKHKNIVAALACDILLSAFSATPLLAHATATPSPHEAMVERGSKEVMHFDMNRTMHIFKPTVDGGVQTVMVHDGDPQQVALVRSHLRKEATAFAHGDFSDPAKIHGMAMPGLAQLRAGANRIAVGYTTQQTERALPTRRPMLNSSPLFTTGSRRRSKTTAHTP